MGYGHIAGAEYLIEGTDYDRLTFAGVEASDGVEIYDYGKSYLDVAFGCANPTDEDGFVDLPLLLYKGYRAVDADTGGRMQVCAGENQVVRVVVPGHFEGKLEVSFVPPFYWRGSELVSVCTVAVLAAAWQKCRRRICLGRKADLT